MNSETISNLRAQLIAIREQVDAALAMVEPVKVTSASDGIGKGYELISEGEARVCSDAEYQCKRVRQEWPSPDTWGEIRYCVYSPHWEYRFRRPIAKTEAK